MTPEALVADAIAKIDAQVLLSAAGRDHCRSTIAAALESQAKEVADLRDLLAIVVSMNSEGFPRCQMADSLRRNIAAALSPEMGTATRCHDCEGSGLLIPAIRCMTCNGAQVVCSLCQHAPKKCECPSEPVKARKKERGDE